MKHRIFFLFIFIQAVSLLLPSSGHPADHLVLSFGPTLNGNTNPKMAGVGYELSWSEASLLAECRGIFSDPINGACSLVLSARVETVSGLFMRVGAGPGWVFHTDDRVSSKFNFNLQGVVGVVSSQDLVIGAGYWHYSNAGITPPNLGRDFIGPVVEIGL
jgi:hypothetical protein